MPADSAARAGRLRLRFSRHHAAGAVLVLLAEILIATQYRANDRGME